MRKNSHPGKCHGSCGTRVKSNAGYIQQVNGKWLVWCSQCVPVRIQPSCRRLTAAGELIWPYDLSEINLVRSIPGSRFVAENNDNWHPIGEYSGPYWSVSLKDGDRVRLLELADKLKMDVDPCLREIKKSIQAISFVEGLYPFQVDGVDWLSKSTGALLGDDMGLGKTIQCLCALDRTRALAIVPACVKHNWADECNIWRSDIKPVIINGRKNFRLPEPGELVIANYELLPKWLEPTEKYVDEKFPSSMDHLSPLQKTVLSETTVIIDEAHKVKNHKTQRAKRVTGLSKTSRAIWGLTGTPLLNRPTDLWGTLTSLGLNWKVFKSWNFFLECFNAYHGRYGINWGTPRDIVPELLRRVMLRRRRKEVLPDLPDKTYTDLTVDVNGKLKKRLDALWDEYSDYFGEFDENDTTSTPKLPPFEDFSKIRAELAESRTEAAIEYAEDCEEQDVPLVVFSAHKAPVEALAKRDGWALITGDTSPKKRQQIVKQFQAGELKGLAATIQAAGVGLTLTHAWKALFIDLDWTPANNWQAEDRICRIGQTSSKIEIARMVSDHVLDKHVQKLLAWKSAIIQLAIEKELPSRTGDVSKDTDGETQEEFEARMQSLKGLENEINTDIQLWFEDMSPEPMDADIPF